MLNEAFYHRVYEKDRVVAAFNVGASNPDFVPFDQISPFLRAAVMTSEDGSFFYHRGFNPGAFRESMVTNIKEKRFARGGSTISMQLVKNIFLTRNKTLARKVEEALIVWLIENKQLVSKQRMFEVYLNIIEWGPGIYGINQASRFYFNKPPSELKLTESIYLASIVPRPKWYRYTFETNGKPRPFFGNYFNRVKELMVRKEFIAPFDTLGSSPAVLLTGPAAQIFSVPDTVATDSLVMEELKIVSSP
jgi:membrane peptidoglycan carboxypeptidase